MLLTVVPEAEVDYLRVEDRQANVIAFADFEIEDFVYADRDAGDIVDLKRPSTERALWQDGIDALHRLAG